MTIIHHLDDATILSYAAGTLGEALSVAAACHISMCPECRTAVRKAEALGGEILDDLESYRGIRCAPGRNACQS